MNNLGLQDRYMIHESKKIYIKKSDAIKIFNDYAIPLYDENVHFKDVAKALVEKIFKKNQLTYDLTEKINKRLNKQWEGKYNNLKKNKPISSMDTGMIEAGKAILKFYRRVRGNHENVGLKRSKTIGNKLRERSSPINNRKTQKNTNKVKKESDKEKKMTNNDFKIENISKFLEKGDDKEVKQDSKFDIFRELMNEKNINYDQDMFVESKFQNWNNNDMAENQFTWFRDPNFKIEDSSSDEEEKKIVSKKSFSKFEMNKFPFRSTSKVPRKDSLNYFRNKTSSPAKTRLSKMSSFQRSSHLFSIEKQKNNFMGDSKFESPKSMDKKDKRFREKNSEDSEASSQN